MVVAILPDRVLDILACPLCGHALSAEHAAPLTCSQCGSLYERTVAGSLDLRLKSKRQYPLVFDLGGALPNAGELTFAPLKENSSPEVDFERADVPYHLSRELMSYFPKAQSAESLMLDLGCGGTIHRQVCEYAGFGYVGLDYDAPKAPILGDAHALPFKDDSFEFILSIAVLEHIRYPFVMMREANRVLVPGGTFIGTVAFLEPFHLNSYYHHTHLGLLNMLDYGGFSVRQIAPHADWPVFKAQAVMAQFQRMPRRLAVALVSPLQRLSRMWWRARRLKNRRLQLNDLTRNTTGAFSFVATKT